jgi:hypothetical protein
VGRNQRLAAIDFCHPELVSGSRDPWVLLDAEIGRS